MNNGTIRGLSDIRYVLDTKKNLILIWALIGKGLKIILGNLGLKTTTDASAVMKGYPKEKLVLSIR